MVEEKVSTIILKIDLDCRKCCKKINKTICKLREREKIQTVAFDEKNNTVKISGPFDPQRLCKKLCCKAGDMIRDIQVDIPLRPAIKKKKKVRFDLEVEPAPSPKKDIPKDTRWAKSTDKLEEEEEEEEPKETDRKPNEVKTMVYVAQEPELVVYQSGGSGQGGCDGQWRQDGCYTEKRMPECLPPVVYGTPAYVYEGYKTSHFFYDGETQSSCSIM